MNPYQGGGPPPQTPPPIAPIAGSRAPSGTRPSFEGRPSSTKVAGSSVPRLLAAGCGVVLLLAAIGVTLWYVAAIATERPATKPKAKATVTAPTPKAPTAPRSPALPIKQ